MFLLVCISRHGVPPLILIHVNAPEVSLLVNLHYILCMKHKFGHRCYARQEIVYICVHTCLYSCDRQ